MSRAASLSRKLTARETYAASELRVGIRFTRSRYAAKCELSSRTSSSARPEVLARWGMLLAEIKRPMDKRRFELVTFAAAVQLKNSACALTHGRALREYFSEREICAIAEDRLDGILGDAEQAMVRLARRVAENASDVRAEDVEALSAHGCTDAEIFDIVAAAAGRAFFTKMLDALGVRPDSSLLALDEELRRKLTVGRSIDTRPCAVMPDG
jgi:alkylhydroperoxidase family enzyme